MFETNIHNHCYRIQASV